MKKSMSNRSVRLVCYGLIACLLTACGSLWYSVLGLSVTEFRGKSAKLGETIRLMLLSDLHDSPWLRSGDGLLPKVRAFAPDVILLAGDLINYYTKDDEAELALIRALGEIAPVYAAAGNHEVVSIRSVEDAGLFRRMKAAGATVLNNRYADLTIKGQRLRVGGLYDYAFNRRNRDDQSWRSTDVYRFLRDFEDTDDLKLLICHKPEFLLGGEWDIDLALCGHEHGGQVRLPLAGGFYTPHMGWFSPYLDGARLMNGVPVVISRGLGSYVWSSEGLAVPPRFWNPPELVGITLEPAA